MFITFEGLDCSGKSTQAKLLADRLSHERHNVLVLREPGGTEVGEKIRAILLDKKTEGMTPVSEFLLFSASRSQLVEEVIRPALEAKMVVVCDRFYDSSTAYQGWGRQIPLEAVEIVNTRATGGLNPDITFLIDIPVSEVGRRLSRIRSSDRMESVGKEFYERVRQGYHKIAEEESRVRIIDGMQPIDTIHDIIYEHIEQTFAQKANV
jgi:dTMP kinase